MNATDNSTLTARTIRPYYRSEEREDAYEVLVYVPGVNREGISISLENDLLEITAKRSASVPGGWRPVSIESSRADYFLRLALNVDIDGEHIGATTENGVLKLILPKAEAVKPRKIQIK